MSVIFRDLWHTEMGRCEASLDSKVCSGSPYILAFTQISSVSKEHHSSREPQKAPQNLYEQYIKDHLQNNYCLCFHPCMTGYMQSPSSDQQVVTSISHVNADCIFREDFSEDLASHGCWPVGAWLRTWRDVIRWGDTSGLLLTVGDISATDP